MNHSFKKIFIVNCFPSGDYHLSILKECLNNLKGKDYKLMVTSHLPLPLDIQKEIDYFIYDTENILVDPRTEYWFANSIFEMSLKNIGHAVSICRNMNLGIFMARQLGYDYFYFLEADNLISEKDFPNFDNFLFEMVELNKKMIFHKFEHPEFDPEKKWNYHTLIFGGTTDYFIKNIKLPNTREEYENFSTSGILEHEFFHHLQNQEHNFLIKKSNSEMEFEGFQTSRLNVISNLGIICEVLKTEGGYILYIHNNKNYPLSISVNNQFFNLMPGNFWYSDFDAEKKVEIIDDDFTLTRNFLLDEGSKIKYDNVGYIHFF